MAALTFVWNAGSLLLLTIYMVWQLRNLYYWHHNLSAHQGDGAQVQKKVSGAIAGSVSATLPSIAILVPFRNEGDNLPIIANTLLAQTYLGPTEIIFIDDHSTDGGAELLPSEVRLLRLADYLNGQPTVAHKKAALTYAIAQTTADLVVTTDADCTWPADRLAQIVDHFVKGADVVLGPVIINPVDGFCDAFQALDLAAYQFLTAATAAQGHPVLANGANFAFRRRLFEQVNGYAGVDHLPSGDDVLLLHKFGDLPVPPVFSYAAFASVITRPVNGWRALWRQRLRWAGKAGEYTATGLLFAQALTFALSLAILLTGVVLLLEPFLHLRAGAPHLVVGTRLLLLLWGGKALVDMICLISVMRHFGQAVTLRWYPLAALVYPFLLVGVGTAALLGKKTAWKGRTET